MGITPGTVGKKGTLQQHYLQPQRSATVPGAGLVDKVLPTRLVGHLNELVLVALGQHLLHGSWETEVLSVWNRSWCLEQTLICHCCYNNLQLTVTSLSFQPVLVFPISFIYKQIHSSTRIVAIYWEIEWVNSTLPVLASLQCSEEPSHCHWPLDGLQPCLSHCEQFIPWGENTHTISHVTPPDLFFFIKSRNGSLFHCCLPPNKPPASWTQTVNICLVALKYEVLCVHTGWLTFSRRLLVQHALATPGAELTSQRPSSELQVEALDQLW